MIKKKVLLIGGSGGVGIQLQPYLNPHYDVTSTSSTDLNLGDIDSIYWFFRELKQDGKLPDILIHAAVTNANSKIDRAFGFGREVDVNCKGLVHVLQKVLPHMQANQYGRIIYLSSILGKNPIPGTGIYAASKSFGETIIRTAALENARYKITCNSLRMGYYDAGLIHDVPDDVLSGVLKSIPLKRLGTIEELYGVIQLLIDNPYITGTSLEITGGL
jgi:3-oxoacyl-[acyl-carrier protein] reductase